MINDQEEDEGSFPLVLVQDQIEGTEPEPEEEEDFDEQIEFYKKVLVEYDLKVIALQTMLKKIKKERAVAEDRLNELYNDKGMPLFSFLFKNKENEDV